MTGKAILKAKEVAQILGLDPKTLRKYVRSGTAPVAPIPGIKPPKWRAADVAAYVAGAAAQ